ncbi:RusA family crossover junction endodeoxyribonuclease [Delftia sp. BR1]|nr:RusA family crossover junction endodeoxyribonuclease [Delftia sp. BR1]
MITFTVPGQPVGKGRPRIGKVGQHARMFTPAKTVSYEGLVAHAASIAMGGRPLLGGAMDVHLFIKFQVPASWSLKKQQQALAGEILPMTKPDIDNIEKAIYDAINGVVWKDDVQVVDVVKTKRYAAAPGVVVTIKPVGVQRPAAEQGDLLGVRA